MINLKKNDKLIIIIAVAVIVVAAIGIIAYESPEDTGGNTIGAGGEKTYDVIWQTHTKTVAVDDECFAGKNAPFNSEIKIDHENILKVTVEISWTDDYTYGILRTKGEDTLTAEITYKGTTDTWESVGNGTTEFVYNINSLPFDTSIDADNELDALDKLKEQGYTTDDSLTLTIDISVQTGERLIRPLKYFRDKGNDFELTITYKYYDPSLTEDSYKDTGNDNNDSDDDFDETGYIPPYMSTIINTGCGRFV